MGDGGGDIIIKGGSCEIYFDDGLYKTLDGDPSTRTHKLQEYKIRRIVLSGDENLTRDFPDGFKGAITIFCRSEPLPSQK